MILQNTTDSIEIKLGGTITTNQLDFVADWVDVTATAYSPGRTTGVTNNTTAVTVVGSPAASTTRKVRRLVVYNTDTVSATVTIQYNENGTIRIQTKATLSSGDTLEYVEGIGFRTLNSSGAIKQVSAIGTDTIPATQVITDASNRFVTDTQKTNFQSAYNNAVLASGGATTTITFATSKYYGTALAPLSTNFTYDFTNAVAGAKAIVFHNNSSEPTYPLGTYKQFGTYVPSTLNILTFTFIDSNTVLLEIAYSTTAGLQPEVVNWLANGGVATGFVLTALNKVILDTASVRSKILRWNLFTGETFASAFVPLIYNLDNSNTPLGSSKLDTNVNFTSAQWGLVGPLGGLNGYTSGKYVDTGFNPNSVSQFGLDDCAIGTCWGGIASSTLGGMGCGTTLRLQPVVGAGTGTTQACNNANISVTGFAATANKIFYILSRTASTGFAYYQNGSKVSVTSTSTSKPNSNIFIFTIDGSNYPLQNSTALANGGYIIAKGLSDADESIIRGAWAAFNTSLARG